MFSTNNSNIYKTKHCFQWPVTHSTETDLMGIGPWIILITEDTTYYFIMLMLGSTCFGHHYAHHQELTTIGLVTT